MNIVENKNYIFSFNLNRQELQDKYGNIPLEEWLPFCKAYTEYLDLEIEATKNWLLNEGGWEEIKQEYIKKKK